MPLESLIWTRHARDKLFYMGLRQSQVEAALSCDTRIAEGKSKFKILCRIKKALFIVVCREDEAGVWVVTVIRKRG